jgi:hypothetical protein
MNFTKQDLLHIRNLATALHKAKYTFDCDEALAFARCVEWFAKFGAAVKAQVEQPPPSPVQPIPSSVPIPTESEPAIEPKSKKPSKKSGDK